VIENPPSITNAISPVEILQFLSNPSYRDLFRKIENEYLYWEKIKYLGTKELPAETLWQIVKFSRLANAKFVQFGNYTFIFKTSNYIQQLLHEFDMNFGGARPPSTTITERNKQYYLLSSIMEEAIASSQMEGANTTRKVAKEMLRKQIKPKDKSQQMIYNNYNTIRFLSEQKETNLTPELLLEIHKRITEKTLDNLDDEGSFRKDDNIYVVNGITGEVAHEPPSYTAIPVIINNLCSFANSDDVFIHPIIKAIIIHFMISFLHPFVDGNGRTARSLFYWYMLRKGYWTTEFLSISRIIYKKKGQYEKAFLHTEHDGFDLGYFIQYNMNVIKEAFEELKIYLDRKSAENNALLEFKNIKGINERQAHILKMLEEKPGSIFECKNLINVLGVSIKTVRSDLEGLVQRGFLTTIPLNQRLVGYLRAEDFEDKIREIGEN
jgi:Fic family protein